VNPVELRLNIDTIVIVIMENRSFDHVLGHLRHPTYDNDPNVNGVANLNDPAYANANSSGVAVPPFFMADGPILSDLPHDSPDVTKQLAKNPARGTWSMNGFVRAFEDKFHSFMPQPPCMGLLRPEDVPTTHALAKAFTVCDSWFACLPTSTAPNRLMSMCGYTEIAETGISLPDQHTVYDWLSDNGVSWRVYSAGLPFFALMESMGPLLLTSHFRGLDRLQADLAARDCPQVIFVEPDYHDCPIHLSPPCDNHPPLAMKPGEAFLGRVFSWLKASPRWAKSALFVTYDEHGGFFDHQPPAPVAYTSARGFSFESTGPRVPAIVASPFAAPVVRHERFDNTSILQLLAERFGRSPIYSDEVAHRHAQGIVSASALLGAGVANAGAGAQVLTEPPPPAVPPVVPTSRLTLGFDAAGRRLVDRHGAEAIARYPQLAAYKR
jgi:phospholipase C